MTDSRRFVRPTFVLIVAAVVVYLAGNAEVPLWDRDEPRYAQCSRQMLDSDDWVVPHLYDQMRMKKPPLIYWLQAASMSVLGENSYAARLPSVIAMALTLLLVAIAVRRALGAEHAFWTVLVLASSVMTVISAKASLTDSVLLLFITIAQLCFYLIWRGKGTWPVICVLGLAIGLTLMTKGPVGLGVHAMTFLAYGIFSKTLNWKRSPAMAVDEPAATDQLTRPSQRRRVSKFGIVAKVLVVIAMAAAVGIPWAIAIEKRSPGFIWNMLYREVGSRSTEGQEGHTGPPGYYLAAIWPILLPWSLLLPAALVLAWRRRREIYVRFALSAVFGPWLMFEIVRTKLPHYLLPCFIPLAILIADVIVKCLRKGWPAMANRAFRRGVVAWGIVLVVLGCMPALAGKWFTPQPWPAIVFVAIVTLVYVLSVSVCFFRNKIETGLAAMGLGALLLYAVLFRVYLPQCEFLQLSVRVAKVLADHQVTETGRVLMLDYKEPSLAFYQGGTIREEKSTIITTKLLERVKADWFVITREVWDRSSPRHPGEPDARPLLDIVQTFKGLDVADGMRKVEVMVVRRKEKMGG